MRQLSKLKFEETPEAEFETGKGIIRRIHGDDLIILNTLITNSYGSHTNSGLKLLSKLKCKTAEVGLIVARLRRLGLIDYQHIETGRHACGSGRYMVEILCRSRGAVA